MPNLSRSGMICTRIVAPDTPGAWTLSNPYVSICPAVSVTLGGANLLHKLQILIQQLRSIYNPSPTHHDFFTRTA